MPPRFHSNITGTLFDWISRTQLFSNQLVLTHRLKLSAWVLQPAPPIRHCRDLPSMRCDRTSRVMYWFRPAQRQIESGGISTRRPLRHRRHTYSAMCRPHATAGGTAPIGDCADDTVPPAVACGRRIQPAGTQTKCANLVWFRLMKSEQKTKN